jgi:RNA-binding protein
MSALTLSPAERAALRAEAHALKPVVLIGAEGLTEAVLAEAEVHLAAHQLIKIRVFGDERETRVAIYEEICDRLDAAPVQHIGKLLVIWRPEAEQAAAPARRGNRVPTAREAAQTATAKPGGRAPRVVKVIKHKPDSAPYKRPKPTKVTVKGNERVTAGGTVKRAKKRQTSTKRAHQDK